MAWGKPWSAKDDLFLRDSIEAHDLRWIADRLGRKYSAVYARAARIGAIRDAYQGLESITAAAERCGLSYRGMLRVLRWAGIAPSKGKSPSDRRRARNVRHYVDPFDATEAVARWTRAETLDTAARRLGLAASSLRAYLTETGAAPPEKIPGRKLYLDPEVYDRAAAVLNERFARVRRDRSLRAIAAKRARAHGESIPQAALRCRVSREKLSLALRVAGITMVKGRRASLQPGQAERALETLKITREAQTFIRKVAAA